MGQIYGILNTENTKIYIGKTINTFERRYGLHGIYSVYFKTHNSHLRNAIEKYDVDVWEIHILEDNIETNEELMELEKEYIKVFNAYDGDCGYNKTLGGEGSTTTKGSIICINTKEVFYSIAEASRKMEIPFTNIASVISGKSSYTGDNIQFSRYEKGKEYELKEISLKEKKVICVDEQRIFNSITEASEFYNIERKNISHALNDTTQYSAGGLQFRFYEEGQTYNLIESKSKRKVICVNDDLVFDSIAEASRVYKINSNSLHAIINSEYKHKGDLFFDYYEDNKIYNIKNYQYKPQNKIICINTGEIYNSYMEAANIISTDPHYISKCCNGSKFDIKGYQFAYYEENKSYSLKTRPKFIMYSRQNTYLHREDHYKFICLNNMKIYSFYKNASEDLGISTYSVGACLRGEITNCKGYQFAYYIPGKDYKLKKIFNSVNKVICIDTNKVYLNPNNASIACDIEINSIRACCNGTNKSAKGYQFAYYEFGEKYELKDLSLINNNAKPVICINTSKVYRSGYRACKDLNIDIRAMYSHLRGELPTASDKQFAYYEKGKEYILKKVNPSKTKIRCITTGEVFNTLKEASEKYNVVRGNITMVCQGGDRGVSRVSAGIHPETGELLKWEYVGEAKKQVSNRAVKCIETGVSYRSLSHAQQETGVQKANIRHVCNGTRKSAGGFSWEYDNSLDVEYNVKEIRNHPHSKAIICLTDGLVYKNVAEVLRFYKLKSRSILNKHLKGERSKEDINGLIFKYIND